MHQIKMSWNYESVSISKNRAFGLCQTLNLNILKYIGFVMRKLYLRINLNLTYHNLPVI